MIPTPPANSRPHRVPPRSATGHVLSSALIITMIMTLVAAWGGCAKSRVSGKPAPAPPLPTYTGPAYLHGTVGSMAKLRGYRPLLSSGYGLVVNLPGTGSADVPAFLRQWLINEMRKKGVGAAGLNMAQTTPARVLASPNTAVVVVKGLIPAGATAGTKFDVLVEAMQQTQTTNLDVGRLWTVDLAAGAADTSLRYRDRIAKASGPIYTPIDNPTRTDETSPSHPDLRRQAVVLSGGTVTQDRRVELILNQPSWTHSRFIADRINERFPAAPSDRRQTAVAVDDALIRLNIPSRYADQTDPWLRLVLHLYTQRSRDFEPTQAQRLADLLVAEPRHARDVTLAWVSLGKTTLPVIRRYYQHPSQTVRLAALEAGARLADEATSEHLDRLTRQPQPSLRQRAARLLVNLPRSLRGARTLHTLLDDTEPAVRIEAYESLARINDPVIRKVAVGERPRYKFILELVPARQPLIYIAQARWPRLVLFDPDQGFTKPFTARFWDNHLMIRTPAPNRPLEVFYQPPGQSEGRTYRVRPTVADLALFLAHQPSMQNPMDGLNLSYSQVASILTGLQRRGWIAGDVQQQVNPLAQAIARAQMDDQPATRPETGTDDRYLPLPKSKTAPTPSAPRRVGTRP